VDDLFADPESEACAGDSLGREEGIEEPGARGRIHTAAVVGNRNDNALFEGLPVGGEAGANHETAIRTAHGIEGVADEIADDLPDLAFETANGFESARTFAELHAGVDDL